MRGETYHEASPSKERRGVFHIFQVGMSQGKGEEHTDATGQEADHKRAQKEDAPDQIVVQ